MGAPVFEGRRNFEAGTCINTFHSSHTCGQIIYTSLWYVTEQIQVFGGVVNGITELWFVTCIQWLTLPVWQQQFLLGKVMHAPYSQQYTMVHICIMPAYANRAGIQADQVTNCTLSRSHYYSRSADHITLSVHQVTLDYRGKCPSQVLEPDTIACACPRHFPEGCEDNRDKNHGKYIGVVCMQGSEC